MVFGNSKGGAKGNGGVIFNLPALSDGSKCAFTVQAGSANKNRQRPGMVPSTNHFPTWQSDVFLRLGTRVALTFALRWATTTKRFGSAGSPSEPISLAN
jgi:hypothetical protein